MSVDQSITKAKYQWVELGLFIIFFSLVVLAYLAWQSYGVSQIVEAANQRAVCGWNPSMPVTKPVVSGTNLFVNSSLEESITGEKPQNWVANTWGDGDSSSSYVRDDGHSGSSSVRAERSSLGSGDIKWEFTGTISAEPDQFYVFQNYSKSDVETAIVAEIGLPDNKWQYIDLGVAPASNDWHQNTFAFTTPAAAISVDVFHTLARPGFLQTDDYFLGTYSPHSLGEGMVSLTFDDGAKEIYDNALPLLDKYNIKSTQFVVTHPISQEYNPYYINREQLEEFIDHGHEIGSHTATHQHLADVSPKQSNRELLVAQEDLYKLLGHTAANLATPYGQYDSRVIEQSKKYYCSHRSTDVGYNSPDNFDLYNIKVQNVYADTPVEDIYSWANFAVEHKVWLVLVFHEIGHGNGKYNYTPEDLNKVLNFISHGQIKTVTMAQGILIMQKAQLKDGLITTDTVPLSTASATPSATPAINPPATNSATPQQ